MVQVKSIDAGEWNHSFLLLHHFLFPLASPWLLNYNDLLHYAAFFVIHSKEIADHLYLILSVFWLRMDIVVFAFFQFNPLNFWVCTSLIKTSLPSFWLTLLDTLHDCLSSKLVLLLWANWIPSQMFDIFHFLCINFYIICLNPYLNILWFILNKEWDHFVLKLPVYCIWTLHQPHKLTIISL